MNMNLADGVSYLGSFFFTQTLAVVFQKLEYGLKKKKKKYVLKLIL